jgi:hypothetical protein
VLHSGNRLDQPAANAAFGVAVVTEAVVAGALAAAALNAPPALLGGWLWYRGEVSEGAARWFWLLLRVGQGSVLVLVLLVGSLAVAGKDSNDGLFYLYALLPVAVAFFAEQLRAISAQAVLDRRGLAGAEAVGALPEAEQHRVVAEIVRREIGVMAASAAVVVFLALRAAGTAHGF